jgi:hypothetical protein
MIKSAGTVLLLSLLLVPSTYAGEYRKGAWTLVADESRGSLSVSHNRLGAVLTDVRLQIRHGNALVPLTGWTVADRGDEGLAVTTGTPSPVSWEFRTAEDTIEVRTAAAGTVITATAPAGVQRIPARLAEAGKMRLHQVGKEVDYTGEPLEERSYVPTDNPHVLYLSLGPVDSRNLHGLFDRPTDIAIRFAGARLSRDPRDPQTMQLTLPAAGSTPLVSLIPDYYVKVLGMPRYVPLDDTYHKTAPTGWNHWLAFFRDVNEQDIVRATDWIAANLKQYGMLHVQLDDGFDHTSHRHWDRDWDKETFPHGPAWLARYIKSKGFVPGLWTVPYSYCVEHGKPEWFLRDEQGKIAMDYQGGGELDFSRPDVIRDYWIPLWKNLKAQGWEYHKFDMGSTVPQWEKNKSRFYDKSKTPFDLSVETLKIFREIMGPEVWHTNHPDNWGGRMGYVDVVGCGRDPGPGWRQMNNFFEVISNNTYQNHIIWYSDPDCIVLRGKPTRSDLKRRRNTQFFNLEEARTAVSLLSIAGLQWLSGDDMPNLEPDRVELIKKSIPILPVFPIDLFGRGRAIEDYPRILDLKINMPSGKYDVVAATNWTEAPEQRSVSFEGDLGLDAGRGFLVFDFWKERLVEAENRGFRAELPSHGTAVFQVHPRLERPQLIANSRHLTGAMGILKQTWNSSSMTLQGTSETVPDAPYTLFIHVPRAFELDKAVAGGVTAECAPGPNGLLKVTFPGQKPPLAWTLIFKNKNGVGPR